MVESCKCLLFMIEPNTWAFVRLECMSDNDIASLLSKEFERCLADVVYSWRSVVEVFLQRTLETLSGALEVGWISGEPAENNRRLLLFP